MILSNELQPIRDWAKDKGILDKGDPKTQTLKLIEEVGELADAILIGNKDDIQDAIGDCVIVLVSIASLTGLKIEDCVNAAYEVIAKRKGSMHNGTFVKEG